MAFYFLFNPPEGLSETGLAVWLAVFAVLTRGAMTLYHVPHLSLGAELSPHFTERTTVVAYRYFCSYLGVLTALGLAFGVYFVATEDYPVGQFNLEAYRPYAAVLSLLMVVSVLVTAFGTWHRIPHLVQPAANEPSLGPGETFVRMFRDLAEAVRNPSFSWLFAGLLLVFMMVGVDAALNLHMNTFYWELSAGGNFAFFVASPIGVLIGATFARRVNELFDKRPSIVLGTGAWAVCQIVPIVLRMLGWFPENGTDSLLTTLTAFKFVQGLFVSQALVTFNSMIADIVDDHELRTGRRQEGIFFAAVSFSSKATTGIGSVVAGFALILISWPEGASVQTAADVPADTIMWLGLLYGPIVSGFVVVCLYCYSRYGIDRARHAEIVAELEILRRSKA